jgi:hypothetical protein
MTNLTHQEEMQRMYDRFKHELENEKNHTDSNVPDFYRNLMAWTVENGAIPSESDGKQYD